MLILEGKSEYAVDNLSVWIPDSLYKDRKRLAVSDVEGFFGFQRDIGDSKAFIEVAGL